MSSWLKSAPPSRRSARRSSRRPCSTWPNRPRRSSSSSSSNKGLSQDLHASSMLISLLHRTTFAYAGKAHDSFNEVRLRPLDDASQVCRAFELRTDPATQIRDYVDFYGNSVHYFDITAGHEKLVSEAVSEVETTPNAARPEVPVVARSEGDAERELRAEF